MLSELSFRHIHHYQLGYAGLAVTFSQSGIRHNVESVHGKSAMMPSAPWSMYGCGTEKYRAQKLHMDQITPVLHVKQLAEM